MSQRLSLHAPRLFWLGLTASQNSFRQLSQEFLAGLVFWRISLRASHLFHIFRDNPPMDIETYLRQEKRDRQNAGAPVWHPILGFGRCRIQLRVGWNG